MRLALLVAGAVVLMPPGAAHGATLTATAFAPLCSRGCSDELRVQFAAEPGEVNDVTVDYRGTRMTLRDDGADIQVEGPGCRSLAPRQVECTFSGEIVPTVLAGDGADRVRVEGHPFFDATRFDLGPGDDVGEGSGMSGGDGDDRLSGTSSLSGDAGNDGLTLYGPGAAYGGPGGDRLVGSAQRDLLNGGGGRDELAGLAGDDELADGDVADTVDADVLDGGEGADVVSYLAHTGDVTVDLRRDGVGGQAGEGDRLAGFEGAVGGSGDDVLTGTAAANRLEGLGGRDRLIGAGGEDRIEGGGDADLLDGGAGADDRLRGGGGDDRVLGGPGADELSGDEGVDLIDGGAGADRLDALDYMRDRVRCGGGRDQARVTRGDRRTGCERTERRPLARLLSGALRVAGRSVRLQVLCVDVFEDDCRGDFVIRALGRAVARGSFACDPVCDVRADATVRLPSWLVARVRRRGAVPARIVVGMGPGLARGAIPVFQRVVLVR